MRRDFLVGMMLTPAILPFIVLPVLLLALLDAYLSEAAIWILGALTAAVTGGLVGVFLGRFRSVSKRGALGAAAMPLLFTVAIGLLLMRDYAGWLPFAWLAAPGPALLGGYFIGSKRVIPEPGADVPA